MKSIGVQSRKEYQIWCYTCWLESYNFHSFIESTHFNEIHQFTIDQLYTSSQIDSFHWVISIEDLRRVREFQIEKHKDHNYQIKSSKQVFLKERKCDVTKLLFDSFRMKIHLILVEVYLYLFLQISIQQLSKLWNWYVWLEIKRYQEEFEIIFQ